MAKTTFTGPIVAGSNGTEGEIRLTDGKNVNEQKYLSIKAPATITADTTLTFPNGAGSAGQILSTDGNGTLSWVNDSAGNPDGTNGQVQFNDGGVFGAIPDGTAGQVLKSNGPGVAPSFQTDATNSPGGSNTNMQFNDNGSFGGISNGTAGQVLTSNGAGSTPTFQAAPAGGIAAVVDDTSPQLGGNLDMNGRVIDGNGPGTNNVGIGNLAFANLSSGRDNTTLGYNAGSNLNTGSDNTFVGEGAGQNVNSGNDNTAIGGRALSSAFAVSNTVAIGQDAGNSITSGDRNTFVGRTAGSTANGGNNNTCLGYNAEPSSSSVNNEITLGDNTVDRFRIPGLQALATTGDVLTYDGTKLVLQTPSGGAASDVDVNGGRANLRGDITSLIVPGGPLFTQCLGSDTFANTSSAINSIAIGSNALRGFSPGQDSTENIAIGANAMGNYTGNPANPAGQQGRSNIAIGREAGAELLGERNICIGGETYVLGQGQDNTAIGNAAMARVGGGIFVPQTGANNTCLGANSECSTTSISNEITLGDSAITTLRCNVTSITALSDARDKKDVEDANIGLDFINDLRPVKFVWDTRDGKKKDIKEVGFIAQELDEVQQKHGVEDHLQLVLKNNPDKLEASQGKLIPILVQAIKDLKKEIDELKKA